MRGHAPNDKSRTAKDLGTRLGWTCAILARELCIIHTMIDITQIMEAGQESTMSCRKDSTLIPS